MNTKLLSEKSLKEIIKNFTPNSFTLNMGTGIAFLTLHNINANIFNGQFLLGESLWLIDIFFFMLFLIFSNFSLSFGSLVFISNRPFALSL